MGQKPGFKTTEFYATAGTLVAVLIGAALNAVDADTAGVIGGILAGAYTFARSFAKTYGSN
jgi:hypothetical protein